MAVLEELAEIVFSMSLGYVGVFGVLCAAQYVYHTFNLGAADAESAEEEPATSEAEDQLEAIKDGNNSEITDSNSEQNVNGSKLQQEHEQHEMFKEVNEMEKNESVEDLQKDLWQLEKTHEDAQMLKEVADMEQTEPASLLDFQEKNVEDLQKHLWQLEQKQENDQALTEVSDVAAKTESVDLESKDFVLTSENLEEVVNKSEDINRELDLSIKDSSKKLQETKVNISKPQQEDEQHEIFKEMNEMEKTESVEDLQKDLWQLEKTHEDAQMLKEEADMEQTEEASLLDFQENVEDLQKDLWQLEQKQENAQALNEVSYVAAKTESVDLESKDFVLASENLEEVINKLEDIKNSSKKLEETKSRKKRALTNLMDTEVREEIMLPIKQDNLMLENQQNSEFILNEQLNSINERAEVQSTSQAIDLMQSKSSSVSPALRRSPHIDDMNKFAEEEKFINNEQLSCEENVEKFINVYDFNDALVSSTSFTGNEANSLLDENTSITISVETYQIINQNEIKQTSESAQSQQRVLKNESWRDEYGLVVEGLSDFYDFQASANPSRSKSRSRNPSPFNSPPESPEVMPNITVSSEQDPPAILSSDEINEMKDFVKSMRAERCKADNENRLAVETPHSANKGSRSRSRSPLPTPDNLQKGLEKRRNKLIEQNNSIFEKLGVQIEPAVDKGAALPETQQGECVVQELSSAAAFMADVDCDTNLYILPNYDDEQQVNSFEDDNFELEELLNESSDDDHIDSLDMINEHDSYASDYDDEQLDDSEDEKESVVEVEDWEQKTKNDSNNNFYDITSLKENSTENDLDIVNEAFETVEYSVSSFETVNADFEDHNKYLNGNNFESKDEQLFNLDTDTADLNNVVLSSIIDIAADDIDLNYKPKREYNWRKNFRLDDENCNVSSANEETNLTAAIENDDTKTLEEADYEENDEENYVNQELVKQGVNENLKNVDSIQDLLVSNASTEEIYEKEYQDLENVLEVDPIIINELIDVVNEVENNNLIVQNEINAESSELIVEEKSFVEAVEDQLSNLEEEEENFADQIKENYHDKDQDNSITDAVNLENIDVDEEKTSHETELSHYRVPDKSHFNDRSQVLSGLSDFYDFLRIESTTNSDKKLAKEVEIEIEQTEINIKYENNTSTKEIDQIETNIENENNISTTNVINEIEVEQVEDINNLDTADTSNAPNVIDNFDILKDANLYPLF